MLERRLDDQNYDSLTQSIKRKDEKIKTELTPLTKVVVETKIDLNDVSLTETENINNININIDNRSKIRSSYGDEDSVTSISSKPIYPSYKDACMNNNITYGSKSRHDNATRPPPVTSE